MTALPVSWASCLERLKHFEHDDILALDFETQGLDVVSDQEIVGVGIANATHSVYIPLLILHAPNIPIRVGDTVRQQLFEWLQTKKLVAHNVPFDGAWYKKETGHHAQWYCDTNALFRQLATEGFFLQNWSLKTAMTDILGWSAPNNEKLNAWLKERRLKTGDMWQAPPDILGQYCALDTIATYHLYEYLRSVSAKWPNLWQFHTDYTMPIIRTTIDQQLRGIKMNVAKLTCYRDELAEKEAELLAEFMGHDSVARAVAEYNQAKRDAHAAKEPPTRNKTGVHSQRWFWWKKRHDEYATKNFFKVSSKKDLRWLFFEKIFETKIVRPHKPAVKGQKRNFTDIGQFSVLVDGKWTIPLSLTNGGDMAVDKKVLPHLGHLGKLLLQREKIVTELKFVKATLDLSAQTGKLHVSMKVPGTLTGRCSGGGLSE
jgi:hypothetical protein